MNGRKPLGFTLLEVIVAMAIVGLVLGTAFGLLAGSKRLAFKATNSINEVLFLRSAVNIGQVLEAPKQPELPQRYAEQLSFETAELLEKPERQTTPIFLALEPYTVKLEGKGVELTSIRWKKLMTTR